MSAHIVPIRDAKSKRNATSSAKGRKANETYRVREHLTEAEMDRLLAALRRKRHGNRDWLIGLLIYRHGLRVSEACDLRWDDIDLAKRTIIVRRLKGSTDSATTLSGTNTRRWASCGVPASSRAPTSRTMSLSTSEASRSAAWASLA